MRSMDLMRKGKKVEGKETEVKKREKEEGRE